MLGFGGLVLALALAAWGWWRYTFPYGYSHSCSKALGMSLRIYADERSGWLPHGLATPEASLSLLVTNDPTIQQLLRGKNVPQKVVDETLARDRFLGPESCGWHYVEGLRESDDPEIAVLWDKVTGLWHNGNRKGWVMHEVVLLDGSMQFVSREKWPDFVQRQRQLLAETIAKRTKAEPPIRWSDEATLGPNVNEPRTDPPPATQTNMPKIKP